MHSHISLWSNYYLKRPHISFGNIPCFLYIKVCFFECISCMCVCVALNIRIDSDLWLDDLWDKFFYICLGVLISKRMKSNIKIIIDIPCSFCHFVGLCDSINIYVRAYNFWSIHCLLMPYELGSIFFFLCLFLSSISFHVIPQIYWNKWHAKTFYIKADKMRE